MAYIQPDGVVQFFNELGISPNYENTLYFGTEAAKDAYFDAIPKLATATALTYSRAERGFIRVELPIATLLRAGYMRFKNTHFTNKWFYAFVKSVDYINHNTTQVNFEIDVMTTWMGTFTLNECFVERQHGTTDSAGDNIVEENLDLGDYVMNSVERTHLMGSYTIIIGASVDQNGHSVAGGSLVNNVYSGIMLHQFATVEAANLFIDELTGKAKSTALVAAVMCPSQFIVGGTSGSQVIHITKNDYTIDTYQPKNKKLFTYPYNYLQVTNGQGNYATFRYEFFTGDCTFALGGVAGLQPEAVLVPSGYKHVSSQIYDTAQKLKIVGFPVCAFNIDQYKAFLAQNSASITADAIGTVASGVVRTLSLPMDSESGIVGGLVSTAVEITKKVAFFADYAKKPTQSNGATTATYEGCNRILDFYFYKQSITRQYARIIDDYFTMFGYAQKRCFTPNMNARPHWTYVKTLGCSVSGALPADDAAKIESIFDAGIRFWKDHNKIGKYSSYNNAPV